MKIRPVEAELFHEDGHTEKHDEANSGFSFVFFFGKHLKTVACYLKCNYSDVR